MALRCYRRPQALSTGTCVGRPVCSGIVLWRRQRARLLVRSFVRSFKFMMIVPPTLFRDDRKREHRLRNDLPSCREASQLTNGVPCDQRASQRACLAPNDGSSSRHPQRNSDETRAALCLVTARFRSDDVSPVPNGRRPLPSASPERVPREWILTPRQEVRKDPTSWK
jgi:hypothetical protein